VRNFGSHGKGLRRGHRQSLASARLNEARGAWAGLPSARLPSFLRASRPRKFGTYMGRTSFDYAPFDSAQGRQDRKARPFAGKKRR